MTAHFGSEGEAEQRWRAHFGAASRRELIRAFEAERDSTGQEEDIVAMRVEQRLVSRYGRRALRAELLDERERDSALMSDAGLVAYEAKWSKRIARLQRVYPARWVVPGLSPEELRSELTLCLLDALRSGGAELSAYERAGREWGLVFVSRQRVALRRRFRVRLTLVDPPTYNAQVNQEDEFIEAQRQELVNVARRRAESGLSRPQRRWLSAFHLSANAGGFFESSGHLNLAAASRLLEKNRSSAQRAFAELQQQFQAELEKLEK